MGEVSREAPWPEGATLGRGLSPARKTPLFPHAKAHQCPTNPEGQSRAVWPCGTQPPTSFSLLSHPLPPPPPPTGILFCD